MEIGAGEGPRAGGRMLTRPYRHADRAGALRLLGDGRAIDQPRHHLQVVSDGAGTVGGLALWIEPSTGGEAYLGSVILDELPGIAGAERRVLFYRLIAACAREAIERGFERAFFTVHDVGLLARIQRDFQVAPQPAGWDPVTGQPGQWEIHVSLKDALQQLERAIRRAEPAGPIAGDEPEVGHRA